MPYLHTELPIRFSEQVGSGAENTFEKQWSRMISWVSSGSNPELNGLTSEIGHGSHGRSR